MNDQSDIGIGRPDSRFQTGGDTRQTPDSSKHRAPLGLDSAAAGCDTLTSPMLDLVQLDQSQIDTIIGTVPGGATNVQDIYPLSPLQEGMLFHHLLNKSDTYVLSVLLEFRSPDQLPRFITALQHVIDRHDILRSAILWENLPKPLQVVYRRAVLPVETILLQPDREPIEQLQDQMRPQRHRSKLTVAPLIRLRVTPSNHDPVSFALVQVHHIVCDHQTLRVVLAEAMAYFRGRGNTLPEPVHYRDYVSALLRNENTEVAESFFRNSLGDIDSPTMPFGRSDVHVDGTENLDAHATIGYLLTDQIRTQSRRFGVSAARLFHAAWGLVVSHTSGLNDIVFGTVLLTAQQRSSRPQRMLGMSVNTLPLRLRICGLTALQLLEHTNTQLNDLLTHEHVPLTLAQRCSGVPSGEPLFTAVFNFRHNSPDAEFERVAGTDVRLVARHDGWTNYPVAMTVDDFGDHFSMIAQTDSNIDPRRVAEYLRTALQSLVNALADAPQTPALSLTILPDLERRRIVEEFNATSVDYPQQHPLHVIFEGHADARPDSIAIEHEDHFVTSATLNRTANQLARCLIDRGVTPDELVAILMDRTVEMVIAILGVWKAGGAYLPLDPNYPGDRIQSMLEDASPTLVLTQESLRDRLTAKTDSIALDSEWLDIDTLPAENVSPGALGLTARNLAYVIYTSGSTGKPKGVMIDHASAINLWCGLERLYTHPACRRLALNASLNFDASMQQILALIAGHTLVLVPQRIRLDPQLLLSLVDAKQIQAIDCTPSQLKSWLGAGLLQQASTPDVVLVGGEPIEPELWNTLAGTRRALYYNVYGPTECTVDTTSASLQGDRTAPHIGRPMANRRLYILDAQLEPVPIGVVGEIYVAGAGISRGYLNRPALTAERVVADPFAPKPGSVMYRTGDLGRWRCDGTVEYLGRNDHQIKIRGHRIELGEIESTLSGHPSIKEAVVVVREDTPGDQRLVSYVVVDRQALSDSSSGNAPDELRRTVVGEWETIHEENYETRSEVAGPSFVGWNSSFTGAPIPQNEMEEWLANTIERIKSLRPKRVLEVGCGVGLVLQHVAPLCTRYVGVDFSPSALRQLSHWTRGRAGFESVQLLNRSASDLHDFETGSFDTVILNSVVQYFPDIEYLLSVLSDTARVVAPGGRIFIGDVRNLSTLSTFHTAVQLSKASSSVTVGQLRNRIERAISQEKELVIDPKLFQALPGRIPGICASEVLLKRGRAQNELTRHRYDVVLNVEPQTELEVLRELLYWPTQVGSVEQLGLMMREHRWPVALIRAVPNLRVTKEIAARSLIEESNDRRDVGSVRRQLAEMTTEGVDPDQLYALADSYGYEIELAPDVEQFEIRLTQRATTRGARGAVMPAAVSSKPWATYANDPLESSVRQQIVPLLREYLRAKLPEYMLPSAWVTLKRLPLTPSGKVDRQALPAPQGRSNETAEVTPPRTELERRLAEIWTQLLPVDQVGVEDNFFELGGHSLLIVQLIERLRRAGMHVSVRTIYENPTLGGLANLLGTDTTRESAVPANRIPPGCTAITPDMLPLMDLLPEHIELIAGTVPGGANNIQDIYPLAPLQEGILFHHLLNQEGGDPYLVGTLLSVSSRQRVDQLIAALQAIIARHDILRTAVLWAKMPRPVQIVYRRATVPVELLVLEPGRDSTDQVVRDWMLPERQRIDLRRAPLMRLQIAADPHSDRWYALVQLHHLTSDHETIEEVISEIVAHLEGRAHALPQSMPYRNHVAQALAHARTNDAQAFFQKKLGDVTEPTALFGLLDVFGDGSRVEDSREEIEISLSRRIRAQAKRFGVTSATLFHAAWSLVTAACSGRDDVVFGTVLLGRMQGSAGAQRTFGMFINTLPLRLRLRGESVRSLVDQTQRELIELLNHEQASLAIAQRASGVSGSTPLFNALLNYRHSVPDAANEWDGATGFEVLARRDRTNYPILLSVDDLGEAFVLDAQTDWRLSSGRLIGYLHTAIRSLVGALEQEPSRQALSLQTLPDSERRQVLDAFNKTSGPATRSALVHGLFEDQSALTPDAIAVIHENASLTYKELNARADDLAKHLLAKHLVSDQPVGICMERSLEMLVALLGILKSGAPYLPLDPNYPIDRLQYMLDNAAPRIVLTQEDLRSRIPDSTAQVIAVGTQSSELLGQHHSCRGADKVTQTPQSSTYVIYTSGSTGRPKGTMMPHSAMVNLIEWHRDYVRAPERVLQFAALSFDVAFQEIFTTLCTGGTLVLPDEWSRRDPRALTDLLRYHSITKLFVPPLMLQSIAQHASSVQAFPLALRDVITAGEQLRITPEVVGLFNAIPGCRLHNHYGPTETHVVTAFDLDQTPDGWPTLPASGRPIANARAYVLDANLEPVPIGVAGELYIGGSCVAKGYLNRPELTSQRFLPDPFAGAQHARMYRTGDLARWESDGTLEYLGRNDDQVKIRGYRIELGEIETQLERHPLVLRAAAAVREDTGGDRRLVAYVVPRDMRSAPSGDLLREHLASQLPSYMIPSAFAFLETLPSTPSGKLDRRALPAPGESAYTNSHYQAPQTDIETALAQIWRDLLKVQRIGRRDDFFDLGGHSLLAVQVTTRIQSSLGVDIPIRTLFEFPTLDQLALQVTARCSVGLHDTLGLDADVEGTLSAIETLPEREVQRLLSEMNAENAK
jgi:amino acid adenylation domain-containing protein